MTLVSAHSVSSTSLLSVGLLILTILTLNILLLPLWRTVTTVDVHNVLDFIKETHFYNKL